MRGGKCRRLSVTSAAAVMVGGIFVCSGTGCCGSGLRTGIGLAGAPSADESESPLVMGMTSGRGMGLATSLDCRGLWLW